MGDRKVLGGSATPVAVIDSENRELITDTNPFPVDTSVLANINNATRDAFGRLRVSNPTSIFDSTHTYDKNPLLWYESLTGTGTATHIANESSVRLRVAANGDKVIRQTRRYHHYQPGKSHLIVMTGVIGDPATDVEKRLGYFDDNNGIFFGVTEDGLHVTQRTKTSGTVAETSVFQTSWNIDRFDGEGPSKKILDLTKVQIFVIDLQWLGSGRVRCGFEIDGIRYYAHQFLNANALPTVYMQSGTLPVRYEIEAVGAGMSQTDMYVLCSSVQSEGGAELELGLPFTAGTKGTARSVTTGGLPVMSIRPLLTFNSITVRKLFELLSVSVLAAQDVYWSVRYGGALTDASWNPASSGYSAFELDVAATAISGGIDIFSGDVAGGVSANVSSNVVQAINSKLGLSLDIDGTHPTSPLSDILTVYAKAYSSSGNVGADINWKEL